MAEAVSIYGTVECDAWSRGFNYDDYLDFHKRTGCKARPVALAFYWALCGAFNNAMAADFECGNF